MITWKTHENGHTQNKPSCTICEETFNSEKALEKHIESKHSAKEELESDENVEITYYCDECDRTTKSSRDLKRHKTAMHRKKSTELETTPNTEEEPSKEAAAEKSSEAVEAPPTSEKAPVQEVTISSSEEEKSKDGSMISQPTTSELAKIMDDWMDD